MDKNKVDIDDTNRSLDLSDATQAVKENRFQDAILLLKRILKDQPDNIDALYLSAVSSRYLKKFDFEFTTDFKEIKVEYLPGIFIPTI